MARVSEGAYCIEGMETQTEEIQLIIFYCIDILIFSRYKDELSLKSSAVNDLERQIALLRAEIAEKESLTNQRVAESEQTVTEYEKIKEAFLIAKGENENLRQER